MTAYTLQRPPVRNPWSALLNEFRREMGTQPLADSVFQGTRGVYPPVNLHETAEGYILTAEIPGVAPESVDVSIEGSTVTLSGERKIDVAAGDGTAVHRRERQSGTFRRAFELPSKIDLDAAKATHKNGVLTLRLPKAAEAKPRQIAIETK
ncbi:MAG TPA: Hsp20/alpha crystallin family protein [Myxococcota bacterium]